MNKDIERIIKKMYEDGEIQVDAVKEARKYKGEINDYLLDEIRKLDKDYKDGKINYYPEFIDGAIFLLAEFRDKRLFPILMDILNNPKLDSFDELGMVVVDKLPCIVASVFNGNFDIINNIIENNEIKEYTESRLVASYTYFYENNFISKDDLEKYLKHLIELYKDKYDELFNEVIDVIIDTKLTALIEDVRYLYWSGCVDIGYSGDYDSFIDDLFSYDTKYRENIYQIEDAVKEITRFEKINKNIDPLESFKKLEREINNKINSGPKVGRNDLCPCGSGKKYKKCCINKQSDILPYQALIDEALGKYPKKNNNDGEIDFYTFYKEEYIKIDKLLYRGLKDISIPYSIKRDREKEALFEYKALDESYPLIKEVIDKNYFKSIEEYDKVVSIHYSLIDFIDKYSFFIINNVCNDNNIEKLEELLNYFNSKFGLEDNIVFISKMNSLYSLKKNFDEGFKYLESSLLRVKKDRDILYEILFNSYIEHFNYDDAKKRMDDAIKKETDNNLIKELKELRDYLLWNK